MREDVSGVRIIPNKIDFLDTEINTKYAVNITVKNVSSISRSIRYYPPQTSVSSSCQNLPSVVGLRGFRSVNNWLDFDLRVQIKHELYSDLKGEWILII